MNRSSLKTRDGNSAAQRIRRDPPASLKDYLDGYREFFDDFASVADLWKQRNPEYHRGVQSLARHHIPPGARVLEIGCGTGDLLSALSPSEGVGIDMSGEMIRLAKTKHPQLRFHQMVAEEMDLGGEQFDYIVLSDLIPYLYDIREVLDRLRGCSHHKTRIIIHWYSRLWQPIISVAEWLGAKAQRPLLNWTSH